ncbi:hypothetical protein [Bacillus sp. FJAT-49736]|uniref:hypothetical protein n=1 Tax=Bacillus sp. FJAT-49736 TaxID=2833582 RepID=UPI001BC9AAA4|nr:hypothetical protein [Bacillus sp. FJAT-49736]MBS4172740.1 hypothetical protein [Bacillus sp. FJAT-49736]
MLSNFPFILGHVTAEPHTENAFQLWLILIVDLYLVISGIVFMYQLFKVKTTWKTAINFGVALIVSMALVVYFGSVFDLLG